MKEELDFNLWLDKTLVQRQNQLKADFLNLFEQVGNAFPNSELSYFFPKSRGKKISKGNQLLGFPYLVLDLIRDFDLDSGCNFRLVSWFGHGLYFCVFLGKKMLLPDQLFVENKFQLGRNDLPWDLAAQVDRIQARTSTPNYPQKQTESRLWVKEITLEGSHEKCLQVIVDEVKKILLANPTR